MMANKFVIAFTAFWCLSEAALRATSCELMVFLLLGDVGVVVVEICLGTRLIWFGLEPDGKSTYGYLLP